MKCFSMNLRIAVGLIFLLICPALAQRVPNSNPPVFFPPNANVNVYVDTSIFGQSGTAKFDAATNCFNTAESSFAFTGVTYNIVPVTNGYPAIDTTLPYIVYEVDPNLGLLEAARAVYSYDANQQITNGTILINPNLPATNDNFIEFVMMHETCHYYGLTDTTQNPYADWSMMTWGQYAWNDTGCITEPTEADQDSSQDAWDGVFPTHWPCLVDYDCLIGEWCPNGRCVFEGDFDLASAFREVFDPVAFAIVPRYKLRRSTVMTNLQSPNCDPVPACGAGPRIVPSAFSKKVPFVVPNAFKLFTFN